MKRIIFALLFLTVLNFAVGDYDYVQTWLGKCSPSEMTFDGEPIWVNSDEYHYNSTYSGKEVCGCTSKCDMNAWFDLYYPSDVNYTSTELNQMIGYYGEAFNYFKTMPKTCCNETTNIWSGMAFAQGNIAKYKDQLGDYIGSAEAYYREAQYLSDAYDNGFNDYAGGSSIMLSANSYRMSGKAYCKDGMDGEAHGMFNSARSIYYSQGLAQDHVEGLIDDEECGQYAPDESCSSAFVLLLPLVLMLFARFN